MGVSPFGDQIPPLEEDANNDQAPVYSPLMEVAIRTAHFKMARAITTATQAVNT